jgi:hypothetical protein
MSKSLIKYLKKIEENALPIVEEMYTHLSTLKKWREEAGPKTKWSAHTKLYEVTLFSSADTKSRIYGSFLAQLFPAHWKMQDWNVYTKRDGNGIRFAGQGGKSRGGHTIQSQKTQLSYMVGYFATCAFNSQQTDTHNTLYLENLGVIHTENRLYNIYNEKNVRKYLEAEGHSPQDAMASQMCQNTLPYGAVQNLYMPYENSKIAFWSGSQDADTYLTNTKNEFTILPDIYTKIKNHPVTRKLKPQINSYNSYNPFWRDFKNIQNLEFAFVAALKLAGSIDKKFSPPKKYLIIDEKHTPRTVEAPCEKTALLKVFLEHLDDRKLYKIVSLNDWSVYDTNDEKGAEAREITRIPCQQENTNDNNIYKKNTHLTQHLKCMIDENK